MMMSIFSRAGISSALAALALAGCAVTREPAVVIRPQEEASARFPVSVGFTDGCEMSFQRQIAPGIEHSFTALADEPRTINVVTIDMSEPSLMVETEAGQDRLRARETVPAMVQRMWEPDARPLVAINGGFWSRESLPLGLLVDEGTIWQGPWKGRNEHRGKTKGMFAVDDEGNCAIGLPELDMHLRGLNPGEKLLIDRVNFHENASYGTAYTWPFGGETAPIREGQTQIVLDLPGGEWLPNEPAAVTVRSVDEGPTAKLDRNTVVIHADDPIPAFVKPGAALFLDAELHNLPGKVTNALGGHPRLVVDGVADPVAFGKEEAVGEHLVRDTHPRTAIGLKNDGKTIVLVVVDGRQPTRSMGITMIDLANYMKDELGCVQAMNLDGGGSSTMVVRGELVNFPSDLGGAREVCNAVVVRRMGPLGELDSLIVNPSNVTIPPGSSVELHVSGRDAAGEVVDVKQPVALAAEPVDAGAFSQNRFRAAKVGSAAIHAWVEDGGASGKAVLNVAEPATLAFEPESLLLDAGQTHTVILEAATKTGQKFYPNIIADDVDVPGFLAYNQADRKVGAIEDGAGVITTRLGGKTARLPVAVGVYDVEPIFGFEELVADDMRDWLSLLNASSEECNVRLETDIVKEGDAAWRLAYVMEHGGTTKVALPLDVPIEGEPIEVGVWVYGDGQAQWLRGDFRDRTGTVYQLDFTTAQAGVSWKDEWRFLRAPIRGATSFSSGAGEPQPPYTLHSLYIVQPQEAAKKDGEILFDGLSAIDLPTELK